MPIAVDTCYIGDPAVDGAYKLERSGGDLNVYKLVATSWVFQGKIPGGMIVEEYDGSPSIVATKLTVLSGSLCETATGIARYEPCYVTQGKASVFGPARLELGTYTGNATKGKKITTAFRGYDINVKRRDSTAVPTCNRRFENGTHQFLSGQAGLVNNLIMTGVNDGFILGSSGTVNTNAGVYHYFVFGTDNRYNITTARCRYSTGSYTGTGNDGMLVTGVGFQPQLLFIKDRDYGQWPVWKSTTHIGQATSYFADSGDIATGGIQAFNADGFQLGTSATVNYGGSIYHYVAFAVDATATDEIAFGEFDIPQTAQDGYYVPLPWRPGLIFFYPCSAFSAWWDSVLPVGSDGFHNVIWQDRAAGKTVDWINQVATSEPYGFWVGRSGQITYQRHAWMAFKYNGA